MKEGLDLFPAGGIHRRVSARSPQLTGQPRLGGTPIAEHGGLGYAEQLGAFRHVESPEEPTPDYQRLTWLQPGERPQGNIEAQQLVRAVRRRTGCAPEVDGRPCLRAPPSSLP